MDIPRSGPRPQELYSLKAPVMNYSWGSVSLLPELMGREITGQRQAEMWFGTHPAAPSRLRDGTELAGLVKLPFLVKLLAAEQPLSIQAHPSAKHARSGFARENAAGIALDDPRRNYRDVNHKPEFLVALTNFTAMVGFRPPAESAETFGWLANLSEDVTLAKALRRLGQRLSKGQLEPVFRVLAEPEGPFSRSSDWTARVFELISRHNELPRHLENALSIAAFHPNDSGALITLMMNLVDLVPGEALFIPSGTIHAYVYGLGLEVMASSDNVIRGGLTLKHVDVAELGRVLTFEASTPSYVVTSVNKNAKKTITHFSVPVREFAVTRYDLARGATCPIGIDAATPQILVCTSGSGQLNSTDQQLKIAAGDGLYVGKDTKELIASTTLNDLTFFAITSP